MVQEKLWSFPVRFAILLAGWSTLGLCQSPEYNFTTIQYPGASVTLPMGINNKGEIVGNYYTGSCCYSNGFLYSRGSYTTIDNPGTQGQPSLVDTFLYGINDSGQISGTWYYDQNGYDPPNSFLYSDGAFSPITYPQTTGCTYVYGLNNSAQVVGYTTVVCLPLTTGFVESGGEFTPISEPLGPTGEAETILYGISNSGQIVGTYEGYWSTSCQYGPPILYNLSSNSFSYAVGSSACGLALGINDSGQVVGSFVSGGNEYNLYDRRTGTFYKISTPGYYPYITGINDQGDLVGYYSLNGAQYYGFLATPVRRN
jgi:hypothetical protein